MNWEVIWAMEIKNSKLVSIWVKHHLKYYPSSKSVGQIKYLPFLQIIPSHGGKKGLTSFSIFSIGYNLLPICNRKWFCSYYVQWFDSVI